MTNQKIRVVPDRNYKSFSLYHKKEKLAGPFKTVKDCVEAKQEWVFGHYGGKVSV